MALKINSVNSYTNISGYKVKTDNDEFLNSVRKYTYDSVDFMGIKSNKDEEEETDNIFKAVDYEIDKMKQESREFTEKQVKKKKEKEIIDRKQRQKVETKIELMKDSGVVWTSGLTRESQQLLMRKSPSILADYSRKQKENNDK